MESSPNHDLPQRSETVKDVHAYKSNFREHGDADAYNVPPKKVDPVDPGYNPDPLPHRLGEDIIATDTNVNGDEAGGIG